MIKEEFYKHMYGEEAPNTFSTAPKENVFDFAKAYALHVLERVDKEVEEVT